MNEDNDGRFPDEGPVEIRYPRSKQEEHGDRSAWPWLPGSIVEQCGPDEWYVCVEVRDLAVLADGRWAPRGTASRNLYYPCCYRDSSEIRRRVRVHRACPVNTDRLIRTGTAATVAGIAAAISYSHMRELAREHLQAGWHAHAFPLSVDGIEIVASLVLLADRRSGRQSGWLPWAALVIGTAGSLAANVATAGPGHDQPRDRRLASASPADRGQTPGRHARPARRLCPGSYPSQHGQ